jgi:subtilase family protein/peptidase inhibitor I9
MTGLLVATAVVAGGVAVPASAAAVPERVVRDSASHSAIRGAYIVVLRDGGSVPGNGLAAEATMLARRHHGRLGRVWSRALRGFSVSMSASDAQELAREPDVAYVEQDQRWRISAVQDSVTSWGLDRVDQRLPALNSEYRYSDAAGAGVRVYVVDTGIRASHHDFNGRVMAGVNEIADGHTDDCNGHGTAVAGVIGGDKWGVAKGAMLIPVRAFDCNGVASTTSIQNGIDWVYGQVIDPATGKPRFAAVINLSISRSCTDAAGKPTACPAGDSQAIITAESNAINAGIPVVASAGNENQDASNNPFAKSPNVITVGATDQLDARWVVNSVRGSNFGPLVKIWAPGEQIRSDGFDDDDALSNFTGASMSAAFVSGAIALLMGTPQFAHATPAQILRQLQDNATRGALLDLGAGSSDYLLYTAPPPVGDGRPIALALDAPGGKLNLFGAGPTGLIVHRVETQPGNDVWGGWLAASHTRGWSTVAAELGVLGLDLVGLTAKDQVVNRRQSSASLNKWFNWSQLDGLCISVAMALSPDGRLEMFCVNRDGNAYHRRQTSPGKGWGPWVRFVTGLTLTTVSAETTPDGRVTVAGVNDRGGVWVNQQNTPNTDDWSENFTLVGPNGNQVMQDVALTRALSGKLELVAVDLLGDEWHSQGGSGNPTIFSDWKPVAPRPAATLTHIVAEPNADGWIVLVGVDDQGAIYESIQDGNNDPPTYGAWRKLDGVVRPTP